MRRRGGRPRSRWLDCINSFNTNTKKAAVEDVDWREYPNIADSGGRS